MKIRIVGASDDASTTVVFPKALLKECGMELREFKQGGYFIVSHDDVEPNGLLKPEPGLYKVRLANDYNVFAYKVMSLEGLRDENIQGLQDSNERDQEGPSGDGDTSPSENLPRQKHRK